MMLKSGYEPVSTFQEVWDDNIRLRKEVERLRAALGPLLDAHWPLVETEDHEDANCKRAREALGYEQNANGEK